MNGFLGGVGSRWELIPRVFLEGVATGPQGEPGSRGRQLLGLMPESPLEFQALGRRLAAWKFSQRAFQRPGLWFPHCSAGKWGWGGPPNPATVFLLENRTRSWVGAEEGCRVTLQDSQMDGWMEGSWGSEA